MSYSPILSLTLLMITSNYTMSQEDFDNLYFNASRPIHSFAKELRKRMTSSEKILWQKIKNRKIANCKFRRQHPIDIFIADFYCPEKKLVIEIDGDIHKFQEQYDINRTAEMENYGIIVIRFTNEDVENELNNVLSRIKQECDKIKSPEFL